MTQIQVYKKNVSLAEKKAHIQQQASMQSNDIDLENLDALEAFIDKFVDMCNNKAKLVCKYSPEPVESGPVITIPISLATFTKNLPI
mgnify:CR=1 FL=1